ncbi:hypothetical protein [Streptomyces sp. NPDC020141]|uniref:hypothetical protein n=1 Tax=Streptomyces sp. NPDC020141 TaxID=3365065 RepID=UPI0037A904BF
MSMDSLVAAGAPHLPSGYFYRVRPTGIRCLKVEVRRSRWIGSHLMASSYVLHGRHRVATDDVVAACRRAHRAWRESRGEDESYKAARTFVGDHGSKGGRGDVRTDEEVRHDDGATDQHR